METTNPSTARKVLVTLATTVEFSLYAFFVLVVLATIAYELKGVLS